jgi:hypothetical protein
MERWTKWGHLIYPIQEAIAKSKNADVTWL